GLGPRPPPRGGRPAQPRQEQQAEAQQGERRDEREDEDHLRVRVRGSVSRRRRARRSDVQQRDEEPDDEGLAPPEERDPRTTEQDQRGEERAGADPLQRDDRIHQPPADELSPEDPDVKEDQRSRGNRCRDGKRAPDDTGSGSGTAPSRAL